MTRRSILLILGTIVAAGCGGTPTTTLKDDQQVVLDDDSPIHAIVLESQPKDFLLNIEVTADLPVDFAFVGGNATVEQAIAQRRAGLAISAAYRKTGKAHSFESIIAGKSTAVLVLRHQKGSGKTIVDITRKTAQYIPPQGR